MACTTPLGEFFLEAHPPGSCPVIDLAGFENLFEFVQNPQVKLRPRWYLLLPDRLSTLDSELIDLCTHRKPPTKGSPTIAEFRLSYLQPLNGRPTPERLDSIKRAGQTNQTQFRSEQIERSPR